MKNRAQILFTVLVLLASLWNSVWWRDVAASDALQTATPGAHVVILPYIAKSIKPTDTPTATATATHTPTPTVTPPPSNENHPPSFPNPMRTTTTTRFQYDDFGRLMGAVTTINIMAASDPDGDPLTYTWSASNGTIVGDGVNATWTRIISLGRILPGTVTVRVEDGRGGFDTFTINFR